MRGRPPVEFAPRLPVARADGQGTLNALRRQMLKQPEEERKILFPHALFIERQEMNDPRSVRR